MVPSTSLVSSGWTLSSASTRSESVPVDGAQRMRRYPEPGVGRQARQRGPGAVMEPGEAGRGAVEAVLPGHERPAVAAAPLVEHRQQGQADAGVLRRGNQGLRHRAGIVVPATIRLVMQIMEFADTGEARLQHFRICKRGNGDDYSSNRTELYVHCVLD